MITNEDVLSEVIDVFGLGSPHTARIYEIVRENEKAKSRPQWASLLDSLAEDTPTEVAGGSTAGVILESLIKLGPSVGVSISNHMISVGVASGLVYQVVEAKHDGTQGGIETALMSIYQVATAR